MAFTEELKTEIKTLIKESSKEMMKDLLKDNTFLEKLSDMLAIKVTEKMNREVEKLTNEISALERKHGVLEESHERALARLDELEQRAKRKQLRIYGVPEDNKSDLENSVREIFRSKLKVTDVSLSHCYRIGRLDKNSNKPRAIVVGFDRIKERNQVYHNKKNLKGSKIVIAEELVKNRYELLLLAREKLGRGSVWTMEGEIYTKIDGKRIRIKNDRDLENTN